jgi:hypothetical protein
MLNSCKLLMTQYYSISNSNQVNVLGLNLCVYLGRLLLTVPIIVLSGAGTLVVLDNTLLLRGM